MSPQAGLQQVTDWMEGKMVTAPRAPQGQGAPPRRSDLQGSRVCGSDSTAWPDCYPPSPLSRPVPEGWQRPPPGPSAPTRPGSLWDHQAEGRAPGLWRPVLLWSQQQERGPARPAACPAHTPRGPLGSFLNQTSSGLTETPPGGLTAHREGAAGSPLCFLLFSVLQGPPSAQQRGSVAGAGRGGLVVVLR